MESVASVRRTWAPGKNRATEYALSTPFTPAVMRHLARVFDVIVLGFFRLEAGGCEHVRGLGGQALMLSRVDDRDRHLRGGHRLRILRRAGNIAHFGDLTFAEKLLPKGIDTIPENTRAASAAMTIIATLTIANVRF